MAQATQAQAAAQATAGPGPAVQNPTTQSEDPNKPKSSAEPIECTVIAKFYDENMRFMEEGQPYLYTPKEGQPFPWKILRPNDEKLAKELRTEYEEAKAEKYRDLDNRAATKQLLNRIAREED